jgi:hypothetical protein
MAKEVTLPSGATVTLRDPSTIRHKDRKRLFKTLDTVGDGDMSKVFAMGDGLMILLVESWSLDLPVPSVNPESLDEMEIADYDALVEHTKELQKALFPSLADTVENETDPKAPTENSNG